MPEETAPNVNIGLPVIATDADSDLLTYSLSGTDADSFDIIPLSGQLRTDAVLDFETKSSYTVVVTATDPFRETAEITVTITVTDITEQNWNTPGNTNPGGGGGGGSGGGGSGGGSSGGGGGGGGAAAAAAAAVVAAVVAAAAAVPPRATPTTAGMRRATSTRSPHATAMRRACGATNTRCGWARTATALTTASSPMTAGAATVSRISSSRLTKPTAPPAASGPTARRCGSPTAVRIASSPTTWTDGERLEDREFAAVLQERGARGIWSDGTSMWVLDGVRGVLFRYDLATGQSLGEFDLDNANGDPHGIWSDGTAIWVSDAGARKIFAYHQRGQGLMRESDEDFDGLMGAGNNSPRGIWSDGDLMYVVDAFDDKIYTYNMPDAFDARLASLSLSYVDIGEFSGLRTEYTGIPEDDATETTVAAVAVQDRRDDRDRAGRRGRERARRAPGHARWHRGHGHRDFSRRQPHQGLPGAVRTRGCGARSCGARGCDRRAMGGVPARHEAGPLQPRPLRGRDHPGASELRGGVRPEGDLGPPRAGVGPDHLRCAGLRER